MSDTTEQVVILAAGLGTRMRREAGGGAALHEAAQRAAATGCKAMMPVGRSADQPPRPFVDYAVQALLEAGFRRLVFVIGPSHEALRRHLADQVAARLPRLAIDFAVQERPLGTAHAVLAARAALAGVASFAVLNADNYYPPSALAALREGGGPATVAYDRDSLVANSNIPAERIRAYAALEIDATGRLRGIVEKPERLEPFMHNEQLYVSMNSWRFTPAIFEACAAIAPHAVRGEFEMADAVQYAIDWLGLEFQCLPCRDGVLDLTERGDLAGAAEFLSHKELSF